MKKLSIISLLLATAVAGFSQGRLTFGNLSGPVDAPDNESATTGSPNTPASGVGFRAQLWCGGPGDLESAFVQIGVDVGYTLGPGYFPAVPRAMTNGSPTVVGGGTVTFATGAGSVVQAQVRAWRLADGATYAAAFAAGGYTGKSVPVNVTLTVSPTPANAMNGLASFNIVNVPEPSSIALGLLGLGAIALFRRRK